MTTPTTTHPGAVAGEATVEVLARWSVPVRAAAPPAPCAECAMALVAPGASCPICRQRADTGRIGVIAVAYHDTAGGGRIVIAERPLGATRWVPVRILPASPKACRMLRRQDGHHAPDALDPTADGALTPAAARALWGTAR